MSRHAVEPGSPTHPPHAHTPPPPPQVTLPHTINITEYDVQYGGWPQYNERRGAGTW